MGNGRYDLEERTFNYARDVGIFCRTTLQGKVAACYIEQLISSSSSIGSNYIEANEALGKKDFRMRIRIARKEAKETHYWLRVIRDTGTALPEEPLNRFIQEAVELRKIFTAILDKTGD